ncbi:Carbohydrate sulfotransferase 3 [Folsomia candida]|uniref:Carbohydrate sulfotransferase 3 n=1 Tax=Folsomia candida TaxID=158441 RepID=A0A226EWB0_FOLCA|nr:Carbohydrate sulfotransferase 3 [Folsomia candida]
MKKERKEGRKEQSSKEAFENQIALQPSSAKLLEDHAVNLGFVQPRLSSLDPVNEDVPEAELIPDPELAVPDHDFQEEAQHPEDDVIDEASEKFALPQDEPDLIIVTQHDPDPGEEIMTDPNNKELLNAQPEPDDDYFPPADPEDPDPIKLLKESSISFQREAIAQKFASLEGEDPAEVSLAKLQLSDGGKPIRNLIFATWGSGSDFVGEAVASHPLTFYHNEPLIHKGVVQIGPLSLDEADNATGTIKALLNCEYSQVGDLVSFFMENQKVHNKNFRLWKYCQKTRQLCMDAGFLSEMCSLFPYQAVNLVRLRLKLSETFLVDEQLDVRVLHLVRDPRAVIHSRINDESNLRCSESVACHDPAKLCSDMVDDFYAAEELREKYPDTFLVLRYEDIFNQLDHGFEVILHHFRLQLHPSVQQFLNINAARDSKSPTPNSFADVQPYVWVDHFKDNPEDLEHLRNIEKNCREAMELWGYAPVPDALSKEFNTIVQPPWSEMRLV